MTLRGCVCHLAADASMATMTRSEVFGFAGFRLGEEVHRTAHSLVFRALREDEKSWVVLKTVPAVIMSPASRARLHKEYNITKDLQVSWT